MKRTILALLSLCTLLGARAEGGQGGSLDALAIVRELSSSVYQGRQAGSPGGTKAGDYLLSQLRQLGIPATALAFSERVPVYVRRPRFAVTLPDAAPREFEFRKDYRDVTNGAWVEAKAKGPLVMVKDPGTSYPKGSIVVVSGDDYDQAWDAQFKKRGAAGILVILDGPSIERRATYPGQAPLQMATPRYGLVKMAISSGIMPFISEACASGAVADLANPLGFEDRTCRNILAKWNGDGGGFEPSVLFMAHYDHIGGEVDGRPFPGALDNASGVALLLSLAEDYAQGGEREDVAFLLTDGEEINLSGASAFAGKPPFALSGLDVINMDMVGDARGTRLAIYSNGDERSKGLGRSLARALEAYGIESVERYPVYNVDSGPLGFAGARAVTLCEDDLVIYHTMRDTSAEVSGEALASLESAIFDFARGRSPSAF